MNSITVLLCLLPFFRIKRDIFNIRTMPESFEQDQEFLKRAHHALLEIEVINGDLVCPETSRKFPVSDGIPNMLLNEDEI